MQFKLDSKMERLFPYVWIFYYVYCILNGVLIARAGFITLLVNTLIFLYLLYCNFIKNNYWAKFNFVYLYFIFLFILILLQSSELYLSFRMWLKYFMSWLCLPIGFGIFGNPTKETSIRRMLYSFIFLFLFNYVLMHFFNIGVGKYAYGELAGAERGSMFDEALYLNVAIVALFPFIFRNGRYNLLALIGISLTIVLTIMYMKRTVLVNIIIVVVLFLSFKTYFVLKYGKNRIELYSNSIVRRGIVVLTILAAFFYFQNVIYGQYELRRNDFNRSINKENRSQELVFIIDEITGNKADTKLFLFGKETFNTVGTYAKGKFGNRMIHENIGIILNGTGLVGLIWYVLINIYVLFLFLHYSSLVDLSGNNEARLLYIVYITYWCIYMVA